MRGAFVLTLAISAAIAVSAYPGISPSPAYTGSTLLPNNVLLLAGTALNLVLIIGMFSAMKKQVRDGRAAAGTLKSSEQRLQTVIDSVQEGITFSSCEGKFEVFNQRMVEITGYTMEEANKAGDFTRLLYPDAADRQRALDGTRDVIEQPGPHASETTITTRWGEKRLLHIFSQMVGTNGNRMFLTTYVDVTEARKADELVHESRIRYLQLFQASPNPLMVYDVETLEFLEVNPAAVQHYGFSPAEFRAMTVKDIRPPEDVPAFLELIGRGEDPEERSGTWRHKKKDGTIIQVRIKSHAIDWKGRTGRLVLVHDITDLLQIEEELRIQKSHFERLFASAPEGIALLDGQGKVHEVNSAFAQMFGFSREEMAGRDVLEITVPDDGREEARAALESVMKGKSVCMDAGRVRKDGQHIDVSIIAVPVDNGRGANMAYVLYRDITQKKRGDKEKEELIQELQKALTDVKTLGGLLPICAWCKKIRDDQGYYHQIETFIAKHSEVKFTHGICPECRERFDRDAEPRELREASG